MMIKMKMSFVNKFENQDRFIEAFIQEDRHPVLKPVKIVFDKNSIYYCIVYLLLESSQTVKAVSIPPPPTFSLSFSL